MDDKRPNLEIKHDHQEFFDNKNYQETFQVVLEEREVRVVFGEYPTYPEAKEEYRRINNCYDGWGKLAIVQILRHWTDTVQKHGVPGSSPKSPEGRVYVIAWDNHDKWVRFRSLNKAREFAVNYIEMLKEGEAVLYQQTLKHDRDIWEFKNGEVFPDW